MYFPSLFYIIYIIAECSVWDSTNKSSRHCTVMYVVRDNFDLSVFLELMSV